MIRNYLKTALRNLRKNKLYSAINISGLMTGLTACLLIGVYITHELSYDKFHVNKSRIVRATMEYSNSGTVSAAATTGTKAGPQFKRTFPAIEEYVRTYIATRVVKRGDRVFEEPRFLYADNAFFKVFSFPLIKGNAADVLNAPEKIVITEATASKYFGTEDAFNKTLTIGGKDYLVSGICKNVPQNSQVKFDFVTQFLNIGNAVKEEQWWTANWVTYFLVKDKNSITRLQQQVNEYMNTREVRKEARLEGTNYLRYHLEPLTTVHLNSSLAGFEPNGNMTYIYMFAVIAGLILLIACANYTNLATAQSAGRSGEIGMRKVMGASKRQVFMQFIGESSAITFIAAALALALSILLIPYFNAITGKHFLVEDLLQPTPVIMLLIFATVVSFLAGAYPALVLSGTQIMGILKKGFNFTGTNNLLRKSLIVVQFGISVFLIIYTTIILQQMNFLQHKNLGYDKDHLLVLPVDGRMAANYQTIKEAIATVPGVEGITAAYETPEFVNWSDGIRAADEKGFHDISVNAMPVDLNFVKTLKMEMVAGRDFLESDFALMDTSNNWENFRQPFIINESLAKKIGWEPGQAIGKSIEKNTQGPVIGVVKDFNFESLHEPVKPLVIFLDRNMARTVMVRIANNDMPSVISRLEVLWKQRVEHRPFEYHFLDEDYNKLYIAEQRTSALFGVSAGLAILLACLGLFGLAAFTTMQRVKEIGIRRVLGADISSITFLLSKNFLLLVSISIFIAMPLAWYAGNQWLEDFAFRISINAWLFVAAAFIVLLIALITVSFQAIRAALANPVKSLRTE
jgi:putative ABC transport system permease protein